MTDSFGLGDRVKYYGGTGTVIDIQENGSESDLILIRNEDGEVQELSPDLPYVKKISEFGEGDMINFPGGKGRIIRVDERVDRPDLFHVLTEEEEVRKVPEDLEGLEPGFDIIDRLETGKFDNARRFNMQELAIRLDLAYRSNRFISLTENRIEIQPYQIKAAHKILNSYDHRYLIADEVGLGKTIETGIVIEELIARERAERILIVTPARLSSQWQKEMREKFDRNYVIYDREFVKSQKQNHPYRNVWKLRDKIITSIDFAKQDDMLEDLRDLDEEWDVAIFDESHHLTARRDDDGSKKRVDRYRVGEAVSRNTQSLFLLTGTPHKGKADQFYFMLELLDPYKFEDETDITPEKLDDMMIRRMKNSEEMVDSDGSPMFPEKEINTLAVEFTPEEMDLYNDITYYIRNVYTLNSGGDTKTTGFAMVIFQKRLASSIYAIKKSLEKRLKKLEENPEDLELPDQVQESLSKYRKSSGEGKTELPESIRKEIETLELLIEEAENIEIDSKARKLREFIEGVLEEDSDEKILIFTEYTDTLEYLLYEVLDDYRTASIHGGLDEEEREKQIEKFRNRSNIMVATDAAREGINLQFAHIMVNYDLPWNPIRIDQRMGRLHRYGQENKVQIYNLFVKDTRENSILNLLVEKIEQIESDLGIGSDVLGIVLDDYDVEDAIMKAVTEEKSTEEVKRDIEEAIEDRKEAAKTIEDEFLIRNKFDRNDLRNISNVIENSREYPVGKDDVEKFIKRFMEEFGGDVKGTKPGPAPEKNAFYQIDVPDVIASRPSVKDHYNKVTFDRKTAIKNKNTDFISAGHPLVQETIEYCQDRGWVGGLTAVKKVNSDEPCIIAGFRIGYITGTGKENVEDFLKLKVMPDGSVSETVPEKEEYIPPDQARDHPQVVDIAPRSEDLIEAAREKARNIIKEKTEKIRKKREEKAEIKKKHARRHLEGEIEKHQERLSEYRERAERGEDMDIAIRREKSEIENLQNRLKSEIDRFDQEKVVSPDEPELLNAVIGVTEGV